MVFREDSIDSTDETLWRLWDCKTAQTGLDKNNPPELKSSMQRAVADYKDSKGWAEKVRTVMSIDFSWKKTAKEYIETYNEL